MINVKNNLDIYVNLNLPSQYHATIQCKFVEYPK